MLYVLATRQKGELVTFLVEGVIFGKWLFQRRYGKWRKRESPHKYWPNVFSALPAVKDVFEKRARYASSS